MSIYTEECPVCEEGFTTKKKLFYHIRRAIAEGHDADYRRSHGWSNIDIDREELLDGSDVDSDISIVFPKPKKKEITVDDNITTTQSGDKSTERLTEEADAHPLNQ